MHLTYHISEGLKGAKKVHFSTYSKIFMTILYFFVKVCEMYFFYFLKSLQTFLTTCNFI